MNESLYTAGREFGLDVAGEESAGFVILLQHGIKCATVSPLTNKWDCSPVQSSAIGRISFGR